MRIKELVFDQEEGLAVTAIALVSQPAIESDFIALSGNNIQLAVADEDQRLLVGAALIPNKLIYRNQDNDEFYIYFTQGTIRKTAELYIQQGRQNEVNVEHELPTRAASVVESWIVEDSDKDKTALYGLSLPKGTWAITMRVHDNDMWEGAIKTGMLNGFSIEGRFLDKFQEKNEGKMSKVLTKVVKPMATRKVKAINLPQ